MVEEMDVGRELAWLDWTSLVDHRPAEDRDESRADAAAAGWRWGDPVAEGW